jgi:hypothetical protein
LRALHWCYESETVMSAARLFIQIELKEKLSPYFQDDFEGIRIEHPASGGAVLCGEVPDQAALHGILERIRDLNLNLVSVQVKEI